MTQDPNSPPQQPMAPAPEGQAQQMQQPNPQVGDPNAFGFQSAPKKEKYNTQYLTANMGRDRRRGQLIVLGIVLAAIAGVTMWVALAPKETTVVVPGEIAVDDAPVPDVATEDSDPATPVAE